MKPIQYYIGILSVLGYVYCLPVVGQVEDKVVRKGNPRFLRWGYQYGLPLDTVQQIQCRGILRTGLCAC